MRVFWPNPAEVGPCILKCQAAKSKAGRVEGGEGDVAGVGEEEGRLEMSALRSWPRRAHLGGWPCQGGCPYRDQGTDGSVPEPPRACVRRLP